MKYKVNFFNKGNRYHIYDYDYYPAKNGILIHFTVNEFECVRINKGGRSADVKFFGYYRDKPPVDDNFYVGRETRKLNWVDGTIYVHIGNHDYPIGIYEVVD